MTRTGGNTPPPWLWPNLLGLDAPAVAVSWQLLFSHAFDTNFPVVLHVILALSVWCIYLADRLYDTMRTDVTASGTDRLIFTRRYFKPLALALAIASAANLALIIRYVPGNLIIAGLITSFLLGTYYAIRLKRGTKVASLIPREILCGMLFSLGCVITPHAYADSGASDLGFWLAALLFGLICSTSCILISIWEREEDLAASDSSIATISPRIVPFMAGAVSLIAVAAACMVIFIPWQLCLPVALSALAQRIILHFDDHLSKPMLRVLGDAVLLTPLVFLWF